jgi:hypothetical protein
VARQVAALLAEHGVADAPVGIDVAQVPVLAALADAGITVVDGQQVFMEARRVKTRGEISLLTQACAMVDAAYTDLYEFPVPRSAGERVRRRGREGAVRPRQRVRRGRQRDLGRARFPSPTRLLRPAHPAR